MPHPAFPKTWILVADAAQANAWAAAGRDGPLTAVPEFGLKAEDTHGFSRDLTSDRPGRSFSSSDSRRSATQPPHDPHAEANARFAAHLAQTLAVSRRPHQSCAETRD